MNWNINKSLIFRTSGQLIKQITKTQQFTSPDNTAFDNVDVTQKGNFISQNINGNSYQFNATLTYAKVINNIHSITGNIRGDIGEERTIMEGYSAVGFPSGSGPNPYYAYQYTPDSKPSYSSAKSRSSSLLASGNYAYNNKYYMDVTYRLDGTSVFGSNKKFAPFYSVGVGWSLSKEAFLNKISWLTLLRLRTNYGINGNQNIGNFYSESIYNYLNNLNSFGQGYTIGQFGNPNLAWQKTKNWSSGLDLSVYNDQLSLTINYYYKLTDPLVINGNLPASSGVSSRYLNAGNLTTRGFEYFLKYSPIYKINENKVLTFTINGARNWSHYGGNIQKALQDLNKTASTSTDVNQYLQRYQDGFSPDAIWAVKSLGIDPSSGNEIFLNKNNQPTYEYSANDVRDFGTSVPKIQGVFGGSLTWKGILCSVNIRYSLGAKIFNSALYNKVENISFSDLANNQDKRALYSRWKNVGDVSEFKAISQYTSTPISSRFIETENYLSGESITFGYEFYASKFQFIKKLGAKSIRLNCLMNDIFRSSNIKSERGIDYPYSKTISFSLNASF